MIRLLFALSLLLCALAPARAEPGDADFTNFLRELWPDAQAKSITSATFDSAFAGVTPDPRIMPIITKRQPEFGKPFGAYLADMVSQQRIVAGQRKAAEWAQPLRTVKTQYGVDGGIVLAIWGIETSYGSAKDRWDVIRSLATLAQAKFRPPYFRDELIAALVILQQGHIARPAMLGSFAGAMGQAQFMPSSFLQYAVDLSGDGRRDIWTNVPDVLGSIGHYFQKFGWKPGLPWGFEVALPARFDYRKSRGSFDEWAALGLTRADGTALPRNGDAILFFPAGAGGPAFLVTSNFDVIKRYNNSDVYSLSAGHLADRIEGRPPLRGVWPANDRQLTMDERIALQRTLAERGYKVRNFTGHLDFDLRDNVREVQGQFGMVPDGNPTPALLERLGVPH